LCVGFFIALVKETDLQRSKKRKGAALLIACIVGKKMKLVFLIPILSLKNNFYIKI
jgi:hypothetical protein